MIERKLRISLEGLWNNPNELFTVRYRDINPIHQKILAKRIKTVATQTRLKAQNLENIEKALNEINPIIFSEYQRNSRWYRGHQVFGVSPAIYIAGYRFKSLCQAIYLMTCRKKALTTNQIYQIARLTYDDWETIETYVNQRLGILEDETPVDPIQDLGIEDIHRAGENTEHRNNMNTSLDEENFTPDENYDNIEENQEEENIRSGIMLDIEPIAPTIREWQTRYIPNPRRLSETQRRYEIARINEARRQADQSPIEQRGIRPNFATFDEYESDDENEDIFEEENNEELPQNPYRTPEPAVRTESITNQEHSPLIQGLRRTFGLDIEA